MGYLLTTSIKSRFSSPSWIVVDEISPGARFLLAPLTRTKLQQIARTFSICQECGGSGMVVLREQGEGMTAERAKEVCPRCKGRPGASWIDLDVRRHIIRDLVHNWENLRAVDPETGEAELIEFSEEVRDALCETAAFDILFEKATQLAVRREEESGKA